VVNNLGRQVVNVPCRCAVLCGGIVAVDVAMQCVKSVARRAVKRVMRGKVRKSPAGRAGDDDTSKVGRYLGKARQGKVRQWTGRTRNKEQGTRNKGGNGQQGRSRAEQGNQQQWQWQWQ
jgi:hypothetical protein